MSLILSPFRRPAGDGQYCRCSSASLSRLRIIQERKHMEMHFLIQWFVICFTKKVLLTCSSLKEVGLHCLIFSLTWKWVSVKDWLELSLCAILKFIVQTLNLWSANCKYSQLIFMCSMSSFWMSVKFTIALVCFSKCEPGKQYHYEYRIKGYDFNHYSKWKTKTKSVTNTMQYTQ